MNENKIEVCRFCLHEEKADDANKVLHIFQSELDEDVVEKIKSYTQIVVSPEDKIPPKICMVCVEFIVNFDKFLNCCWKSEKVLREVYGMPNETNRHIESDRSKSHMSNEQTVECAPKTSETLANSHNDNEINNSKIEETGSDDFVDDSDSDFSSTKENAVQALKEVGKSKMFNVDGSIIKIIGDNKYYCNICSKQFKTFSECHHHQESHNGQLVFSCTICDEVFSERKQLVDHEANHKVACQVCSKLVLPKSLPAHLKKHTDLYRCPECNLCLTSKAALEKHIQARHKGQKGLVCHICGKQSSCQSSLNRHLAYHSTARPYQCKYCSFSTKSPTILRVHTSRKHVGIQRSCEACGKTFKSDVSLKQHMKRIHNPRKHVCHLCHKAFIEKYSLEKHILRKHSRQNIHECKVCNKEFNSVRQLKEHMYSHRQGCVSCPNCGKQFFYKRYLEKHLAKCAPDKPNENFRDRLQRLKSTISLPGSTMQLDKLKD